MIDAHDGDYNIRGHMIAHFILIRGIAIAASTHNGMRFRPDTLYWKGWPESFRITLISWYHHCRVSSRHVIPLVLAAATRPP